jgi:hypothetical protein
MVTAGGFAAPSRKLRIPARGVQEKALLLAARNFVVYLVRRLSSDSYLAGGR